MKNLLLAVLISTPFISQAKVELPTIFAKKSVPYFETTVNGELYAISAVKTSNMKKVQAAGMAPRGSAVLTPSGALKSVGINNIIHVAPGAMTETGKNFDPTLKGLRTSLMNSVELAKKHKLSCLAVPFIGGGIFLHAFKMTKEQLAKDIIQSMMKLKPSTNVIFVTWGQEDTDIFQKVMSQLQPSQNFSLAAGSITDFKLHKCDSIVNAANMEISFGGGISGVIGNATEKGQEIDAGAKELLQKYYGSK